MSDLMQPPWINDPPKWVGADWILGKDEYLGGWQNWYHKLPDGQKVDYREANPEPENCKGFYHVFGQPPSPPISSLKKYKDANDRLLPPWLAFPEIGLGSIGWRMGSGEDYWLEFAEWYRSLNRDDRLGFIADYPEPEIVKEGRPWTGFYERLEKY